MRFGYGFVTCQRHPELGLSDADLYREALELAVEAEGLGFDSIWTSEHHFWDDSYVPSLMVLSAAIAARTDRIQIGTGVLLAPLHDPVRLAEDAAVVDLISRGRLTLGLGLAWLDWESEAFGTSLRYRVPRTVEVIETCRQSWGDGLVERLGVSVTPKPLRAGGPPIWLGGYVEPSIRRAAAIGDGWLGGGWSDEEFAEAMGWLRSELAARGRTDFQVGSWWTVFTWDGPDAWERVRPHLRYMDWKYEDAQEAKGRLGPLPMPPELSAEAEEELRSTIICGTPDEVAERIERLRNIGGEDLHFVGRQYFPGMDRETMRRSMQLFGHEVIPRFR